MSSLWTPGGERPIPRTPAEASTSRPAPAAQGAGQPVEMDDEELTPEQMAAEMEAVREQLSNTPAAAVVANHCFGLFELAALHLSLQPPQISEASLAIDAMAALVEGLGERLGEHRGQLNEALAQLRLAFVQIRAANLGAPPV